MIKADLVDELYLSLPDMKRKDVSNYVDKAFEIMGDAIVGEGSLRILNFGIFEVRRKNARMGRNPKTKEAALITARNVVSFRASKFLLNRLNSSEGDRAVATRRRALEEKESDKLDKID